MRIINNCYNPITFKSRRPEQTAKNLGAHSDITREEAEDIINLVKSKPDLFPAELRVLVDDLGKKQQELKEEYQRKQRKMLKTLLAVIIPLWSYSGFLALSALSSSDKEKEMELKERTALNLTDKRYYMPNEIMQNSGWNKNIKVLASSSYKAASIEGSYTPSLFECLKANNIQSIEQAHDAISGTNLIKGEPGKYFNQYCVKSAGELKIWNKSDKNKHRFVLLISGNEKMFEDQIDKVKKDLTDIYNLPWENIYGSVSSKDEVDKAIESIADEVKDFNSEDVEILIYANLHGNVELSFLQSLFFPFSKKEGELDGELDYGIKEKNLKPFINRQLNKGKTLFIIDACHSGSWVQNDDKKNTFEVVG